MYSEQLPLDPPLPENRPPRILITAVQIPFVTGGAESHIESMRRELVRAGFLVDVVRLPLKWYPPRQIINDAMAWRMLDLTHIYGLPVDLVIATRFPSYAVRHPRKIAWVLHQHRQAYDLLNTEYTDFKDSVEGDHIRQLIYELDKTCLEECREIFANSQNVAARMGKYLGVTSKPLYHPPPLAGQYRCDEYGDFIFSAGRLELNKRVDLLLHALANSKYPIPAVIAGDGPQKDALIALAEELGIRGRVTFAGYVTDEDLLRYYATCGAVFYAPLDEDYGYVTLESFLSSKPVITSTDAGGVLEFVRHGENGFVGVPEPEAMGRELDRWYDSDNAAPSMGKTGLDSIRNITWDRVVSALTATLR